MIDPRRTRFGPIFRAGAACVLLAGMLANVRDADAAGQTRFERLSDDLVLGQTSIQAFAQDRDGYLWLGTQAGVEKFDGYRFDSFRSDPNDPATLSHRFVSQLMVAENGHVWVGTSGGLNRIDPGSGRVARIGLQLPDGQVVWPRIDYGSLVEDASGDIFAAGAGMPMRWRSGSDALLPVEVLGPDRPVPSSTLRLDRAGRLWLANPLGLWRFDRDAVAFRPELDSSRVGTNPRLGENMLAIGPGDGVTYAGANGAFVVDPGSEQPIRQLRPGDHGFESDRVNAVAVDSGNNIWLRLADAIVRIPAASPERWQRFAVPSFHGATANSNRARLQLVETRDGGTWLAGRFGLVRHDPGSDRLERFRHDPNDRRSLPQTLGEIGYRIFLDDFDVLWIGANLGGLARHSPHSNRFTHVHDTRPSSISRNIVRAIAEQQADAAELVWVANQNAGISTWQRNGPRDYELVHHYPPDFDDRASVGVVRSIAVHPENGSVWLAGSHALGRIDAPGAAIERFELNPPAPATHPGLRVLRFIDSTMLLAGGGRAVWLIDIADADRPRVSRRFDLPSGISVFDLAARADGRILVAGLGGLIVLDPVSGEARHHFPAGRPGTTPLNDLFHLAFETENRVWAGTRGAGLLRIDLDRIDHPEFEFLGAEHGLPDDTIYAVLPDATGSLWLSSNRGIIRFDPAPGRVRRYTPADNLQAWEFNNTVAHAGASGRFYFGGINGWNVFRPGDVRDLLQPPRVQLQSVTVNDRIVEFTDDRPVLDLAHDENRVVIDYVGLHLADPDRVRYEHRLDGLDPGWVAAGGSRQARYASLAPGSYRFEVKAANLDGVWSSPGELLRLNVRRPPWFSLWAWLLYFALAVALVLGLLARQKRKRLQLRGLIDERTAQLRRQKDLVDQQASELERALEARTQLFANVSHEFRTPLTLVLAAIDRLERRPDPETAAMGRRYVNQLLRMVEQLLDLSRLKLSGTVETESPWRLDSVVSQTLEAFQSAGEQQGIRIEARINGVWHTRCPQNLVEKILINLIGNAIKFTPAGGFIRVSLQPSGEHAVVCVEDSGAGIPDADRAKIFKRFYRAQGADSNHVSGAGIGLALVAEAARACGGSVDVTSRPGHGTCFWVTLPASRPGPGESIRPARVDFDRRLIDLEARQMKPAEPSRQDPQPAAGDSRNVRGTVLVVEDNADLREYLAASLSPEWRVEQAVDGNSGFGRARDLCPDLIISDLMMPNGNGFEMLARLREDIETSHIPVLFLTARQDHATRLKAFALSADAFLSKPFDLDELRARLEQMMAQRERIRVHLLGRIDDPGESRLENVETEPGARETPGDLSPRDRTLLDRLSEWLETGAGNPGTDVQAMADAVHVTPRTLQRKLKSLTGRTPAPYLRQYRLARARRLLCDTGDTLTEIAHACGFSSSQHFSRAFREAHGMPPDKWRRDQRSANA